MRGSVRYLNLTNAMAVLETENGFTLIEVLERCAIDISDRITGPLDSPGGATLRNESKDEDFDVSIEQVHCSREEAIKLLG